MQPQETIALYAVGRDGDGNFVGLQNVAWRADATIGTVDTLVGPGTQFTATQVGIGSVTATNTEGRTTSTGPIAVHGIVGRIAIQLVGGNDAGAGVPAAARTLRAGDMLTLHAAAYDGEEYSGPVSASWTAPEGIGTFSAAVGPSTTFTATTTMTDGTIRAIFDAFSNELADITVNPGPLDHFTFDDAPGSSVAGESWGFTLRARDAFDNFKTDYVGNAVFSSSDPNATLPAPATFAPEGEGKYEGQFGFVVAGQQTLTATDAATLESGTSAPVAVLAAALDHFKFGPIPSPQTAAAPFPLDVYAKDEFENVVPVFNGIDVALAADEGQVQPTTLTFVDGHAATQASVTLSGDGRTLLASDAETSVSGQSDAFDVEKGPLHHLRIHRQATDEPIGDQEVRSNGASARIPVYVAGYDAGDNRLYPLPRSASEGLDDTYPLVSWHVSGGIGTVAVSPPRFANFTPGTIGIGVISVSDDTLAISTGSITVMLGDLATVTTSASTAFVTAGEPLSVTVTVKDAGNNIKTDFAGTVILTTVSTPDPLATLPGPYAFVPATDQGVHTFDNVILKTARSVQIRATATTVSGSSASITVGPTSIHHYKMCSTSTSNPTAPCNAVAAVAGQPEAVTITARDVFGNIATGHSATTTMVYTGPSSSPFGMPFECAPSVTFSNGQASAVCTFKKVEPASLQASDNTYSTPAADKITVNVGPAVAKHLHITLPGESFDPSTGANTLTPSVQTAGVAFAATTIRALDEFGNIATGYAGGHDMRFSGPPMAYDGTMATATNAQGAPIPFGSATNLTFSAGQVTTSITLYRAAGGQSITATEWPATAGVPKAIEGLASSAVSVASNPVARQLGVMYDAAPGCDPAKLANKDRACLVASESMGSTTGVILVPADEPITFWGIKLDEWDNVIDFARMNWRTAGTGTASGGGASAVNQFTFTLELPSGSQERVSVTPNVVTMDTARPAEFELLAEAD